jgi:hypothetical protein
VVPMKIYIDSDIAVFILTIPVICWRGAQEYCSILKLRRDEFKHSALGGKRGRV